MELWNASGVRSFSEFASHKRNSSKYSETILRDTMEFSDENSPQSSKSHGRFSGFFVPPHTGDYTFFVSNDDVGQLYMSDGQGAGRKVRFSRFDGL